MNNYIYYHLLLDIKNEIENDYYKNTMLNRLEEFIEWIKLSLKRFCTEDDGRYILC